MKRKRRLWSFQRELIIKAREAAMAAVQIFNNPQICFKSEMFIVLMVIAWTYLLHAYFRKCGVDYRYVDESSKRKRYLRTHYGAYKYWELDKCLGYSQSLVDATTANNLKFLIGIRHEIEHQMTTQIDDKISAKFQSCCINFNKYIKELFGDAYGIDNQLAFSLQFSAINLDQVNDLTAQSALPANIKAFIAEFEQQLPEEQYNSPQYAYRVIFTPKMVNNKNQADKVIEFIPPNSPLAQGLTKEYAVIKETEKTKYLPSEIVKMMHREGYTWFNMHNHTQLWQSLDAKNPGKGFGVKIFKTWYWYEPWLTIVKDHCKEQGVD